MKLFFRYAISIIGLLLFAALLALVARWLMMTPPPSPRAILPGVGALLPAPNKNGKVFAWNPRN